MKQTFVDALAQGGNFIENPKGTLVGKYNNFYTSISMDGGLVHIWINLNRGSSSMKVIQDFLYADLGVDKTVKSCTYDNSTIKITMKKKGIVEEQIAQMLNRCTSFFSSNGMSSGCGFCGNNGNVITYRVKGVVISICESCYENYYEATFGKKRKKQKRDRNVLNLSKNYIKFDKKKKEVVEARDIGLPVPIKEDTKKKKSKRDKKKEEAVATTAATSIFGNTLTGTNTAVKAATTTTNTNPLPFSAGILGASPNPLGQSPTSMGTSPLGQSPTSMGTGPFGQSPTSMGTGSLGQSNFSGSPLGNTLQTGNTLGASPLGCPPTGQLPPGLGTVIPLGGLPPKKDITNTKGSLASLGFLTPAVPSSIPNTDIKEDKKSDKSLMVKFFSSRKKRLEQKESTDIVETNTIVETIKDNNTSEETGLDNSNKSTLTGIVGALTGSMIGVLVWVLAYELQTKVAGFEAVVEFAAVIMPICTVLAYCKFCDHIRKEGIVVTSIITIVMLFFAFNLTVALNISDMESAAGGNISLYKAFTLISKMLSDNPESKTAYIHSLIGTYLLATFVGGLAIYILSKREDEKI